MLKKSIILLCLCLTWLNSYILPVEARYDTGGEFLTFGVGARASGMGEAFVAVADDASAIHFNPAGLGLVTQNQLFVIRNHLYEDIASGIYHNFFSYIYPTSNRVFGCGINLLQSGSHPITNYNEALGIVEQVGTFKTSDMAVILSCAQKINKNLSLGGNIKYIYSKMYYLTSKAYAIDLGALYQTPIDNLSLGVSLINLGSKIYYKDKSQSDELPLTLNTGTSYRLKISPGDIILFACDINKPLYDRFVEVNAGIEYQLFNLFAGRIGFFNKPGNLRGVTYGVGFKYKDWNVDFANLPLGDLGRRDTKVSITKKF